MAHSMANSSDKYWLKTHTCSISIEMFRHKEGFANIVLDGMKRVEVTTWKWWSILVYLFISDMYGHTYVQKNIQLLDVRRTRCSLDIDM